MIDVVPGKVHYYRLEFDKSFTFDVRVLRRVKNEPFRLGDGCNNVRCYHSNGKQFGKFARANPFLFGRL